MNDSEYPSKLLENAVAQIATLPGVGRKSALRLVLNLLRRSEAEVLQFSNAFIQLKQEVKYCAKCHNISDTELCNICSDSRRDNTVLCVVENIRDVMSVEATHQFKGLYHVLGGIISPMDGVSPSDLNIDSLQQRIVTEGIKEIIIALSTTMEGDTTAYYLYRRLNPTGVKITTIARGIAIGDELQYADELTLGRSILDRIPFDSINK
ncbi:MAG: recombination mediator RecR [Paludibacteraceae bacterium]|nr:recombination mediator RecR [Paludibacteraceae bacterium]